MLHKDLLVTFVRDVSKLHYHRFHKRIQGHPNPMVNQISILAGFQQYDGGRGNEVEDLLPPCVVILLSPCTVIYYGVEIQLHKG